MSKLLAYTTVLQSSLEFCCQECSKPFSVPHEEGVIDAEKFACTHCGEEVPAADDSIHGQTQRIVEYAHKTAIPKFGITKITELISVWDVTQPTIPLYDRPAYRHISDLNNNDHVAFDDLQIVFQNSADFFETASRLIRCGKHIHDVHSGLVLSPHGEVNVSTLFEVLDRLQADAIRSSQNLKYKEQAKRNGRMLNGEAPYGFKILRDEKNRPFLVPDWKERKLMSELIRLRDEGYTWKECVTQARVRNFRNIRSDDGIYRDKTIRRIYDAAKVADFAFSEA